MSLVLVDKDRLSSAVSHMRLLCGKLPYDEKRVTSTMDLCRIYDDAIPADGLIEAAKKQYDMLRTADTMLHWANLQNPEGYDELQRETETALREIEEAGK